MQAGKPRHRLGPKTSKLALAWHGLPCFRSQPSPLRKRVAKPRGRARAAARKEGKFTASSTTREFSLAIGEWQAGFSLAGMHDSPERHHAPAGFDQCNQQHGGDTQHPGRIPFSFSTSLPPPSPPLSLSLSFSLSLPISLSFSASAACVALGSVLACFLADTAPARHAGLPEGDGFLAGFGRPTASPAKMLCSKETESPKHPTGNVAKQCHVEPAVVARRRTLGCFGNTSLSINSRGPGCPRDRSTNFRARAFSLI